MYSKGMIFHQSLLAVILVSFSREIKRNKFLVENEIVAEAKTFQLKLKYYPLFL